MTPSTKTIPSAPGVYAIRNIQNGHLYIGSSKNMKARWRTHRTALRSHRHASPIMQRAYEKYGEEAFDFEVLEIVEDLDRLIEREQFYIDTLTPDYNISDRAYPTRLGMKSSPEHVARMSTALKGRPGTNKGKTFTKEHRHKISEALRHRPGRNGWRHTEETKAKIRERRLKNPTLSRSDEVRAKAAASLRLWQQSRTPEQRQETGRKISEALRGPDRKAECIVCGCSFSYRPNGSKGPKTCSPTCLAERRRQLLSDRRKADPEYARRAVCQRWSSNPQSPVTHCVICDREIPYQRHGSYIPKTCGSACRSELSRRNLALRRAADPESDRRASLARHYPNGSLYQPIYQGERDDVDCDSVTTLKLKPGGREGDDTES